MLSRLRSIAILVTLMWMCPVQAMGFIEPPTNVITIARELAYKDFPRAADILAIIRIESAFNPKAKNKMSNGIMQVNYGPFNIRENMVKGVALLREYYEMTHSVIGAVKSYNIGIGNYFDGLLKRSAEDYWMKFKSQLRSYEDYDGSYQQHLSLTIVCLGCVAYVYSNKEKGKYQCKSSDSIRDNYISNY
jgi:hypothetical protein